MFKQGKKFLGMAICLMLILSVFGLSSCSGDSNDGPKSGKACDLLMLDDVEYTVRSVDYASTVKDVNGGQPLSSTSKTFMSIGVEYNNKSDESKVVNYQNMELESEDHTFKPDAVAAMSAFTEDENLQYRDVPAGESGLGKIIFLVPDEIAQK